MGTFRCLSDCFPAVAVVLEVIGSAVPGTRSGAVAPGLVRGLAPEAELGIARMSAVERQRRRERVMDRRFNGEWRRTAKRPSCVSINKKGKEEEKKECGAGWKNCRVK